MNTPAEYAKILKSELEARCQRNRSYSIRRFARALGIPYSTLSLVLAGKRVLSLKAARQILKSLDLPQADQEKFLASLGTIQRARGLKRMNPVFRNEVPPPIVSHDLDSDHFRAVSDWYHTAILVLTETEGFSPDPARIATLLGIAPVQAELALERLIKIGLLRVRAGQLIPSAPYLSTTKKQASSEALRTHQRQMLEKAIESLDHDPIEKRCMSGVTMAIDPGLMPKARAMISEFNQNSARSSKAASAAKFIKCS